MDKTYVLGLAYYHPGLYNFIRSPSFRRFPGTPDRSSGSSVET
jgi:hypothetical protein